MNADILEKTFVNLFQNEIQIIHKDKQIRRGRLILYSLKDFYINLKILTGSTFQIYELPYPFEVTHKGLDIILSYKTVDFTKKYRVNPLEQALYFYSKPSKFFDSEVFIKKA